MPSKTRPARPAMYNTPAIRNGGFGALQLEAVTNRPLSIARRHLAASQLRMADIEPHELSSSEWLRFLVMEDRERDRWMTQFRRTRRNSDESTGSADLDRDTAAHNKAEEAAAEAREAAREARRAAAEAQTGSRSLAQPIGATPAVVAWARNFDNGGSQAARQASYDARQPVHASRTVGLEADAPPQYSSVVRARTPPPNYETRSVYEARVDDDEDDDSNAASPSYLPPAV